jgi:hypothetical protein
MALENKYNLIVNLKAKRYGGVVPNVTANDNTVFEIQVIDDTVAYPLLDTYRFTLVTYKKNKPSVIREGSLTSGGLVRFELGSSETTVSGKVEAMVQIYDEADNRISSAPLTYNVIGDPSLNGSLPADETTLVIANETLLTESIEKSEQAMARVDELITQVPQPSEVVDARGGEVTLGSRLNNLSSSLAQKANKTEIPSLVSNKADINYVDTKVASVASGSPKGVYATLTALQTAIPAGNSNIYVVSGDGKWYYWNGSAWTAGGVYQSSGIPKKSIVAGKTDFLTEIYPNLVDSQVIKESGYWNGATFTTDVSFFTIEDYIPVQQGVTYRHNAYSFYGYDTNKALVSTLYNKPTYTLNNASIVYIRPTFQYSSTNTADAFFKVDKTGFKAPNLLLEKSNIPSKTITAEEIADKTITSEKLKDGALDNSKLKLLSLNPNENFSQYGNLLTYQTIKENGYWEGTTWATDAALFSIEGYIPIKSGETYVNNAYTIFTYDSNMVKLATKYPNGSFLNDNANAVYARPNFQYSTTSVANAKFEGKRYITTYSFAEDIKVIEDNLGGDLKGKINSSYQNSQLGATTKFMHMSADDIITIFEDLTTNAATYTSIFNNGILAFLKSMHDTYGMVFSGYCFYQNATFNLSQCTNKFANEFSQNSNWLKFGFHSLDTKNYSNETAANAKLDYETTMTELFRVLGSWECIDKVPRLHNYAGNLVSVNEFKNTSKFGIIGLLSAEDVRTSYYQTAAQRDFLQTHDRLFDSSTGLTFFSTDIRLEDVTNVSTELANRKASITYADRMNDLVIFTHEYLLNDQTIRTKIEQCCQFAVANGYRFDYPMNKLLK